ncbi:DUF6582 domain-containing protein [Rhizobium lusitanum]|uniref:DUF6582 domain-containing protein n=1 Tax=Rhizobium lusitanum TaxID=293958 RepID=UPI00195D13D8|nr:DUF6582 domain-containing protein [Rhizobium lusitanum]MBM7045433.1 hypothetical protein [Rhizobium lusitanum]
MTLTKEARDELPESDFAVPSKRALPIQDAVHVRMAWRVLDRTQGLSDAERKTARERILKKAKALGIDTSDWQSVSAMAFEAMAIVMPVVEDHPNRMPFSGVLTRIDEPSDNPPHGSNGKLVMLPRAVAEQALPSLLGMAVDFEPGFKGHDPQAKIGVITAATIEGTAIHIEGFIYASDFPEEAAAIQIDKDKLGFSFEAKRILVETMDADPLVITECVFTGAAILLKDRAAYTTTSLAASADLSDEDILMSDELKKLLESFDALSTKLDSVSASVEEMKKTPAKIDASTEHTRSMVEPHATALESCAASMEASGIGSHSPAGHAAVLRRMAGSMRAEAAIGKVPAIYHDRDSGYYASAEDTTKATAAAVEAATKPLKDELAAMDTKLADLKAAGFKAAEVPERKTLSPAIAALLAKSGLGAPEGDDKLDPHKVSKALADGGMDRRAILEAKTALARAGLMI